MRILLPSVFASLLWLTLPSPGLAQDSLPATPRPDFVMEEIQVTATRTERRPFEVPAPVTVVSEREIDRVQPSKPGELFARQPGLEVEGAGPFLGQPVIRGLSGNRVLVLVDGQRLNNSREAINFGGVQPALVDVGQIESIEITRGPASVLYGSDAIGGIVNIITKRPPVPSRGIILGGILRPRLTTATEQQSGHGELYAAGPAWSLLVSGTIRDAEDYSSPAGEVVNSAAETRNLAARLELRPADDHRLWLDVQSFRGEDIGLPGAAGVFTGFYPRTDRDKVGLRYEGQDLAAFAPRLEAGVYFQDQTEDFSTILDLPPIPAGPFALLIDTESSRVSDVRTVGFDVQADAAVGGSHLLTYGLEFFRDDVAEERREVTTTRFEPTQPGPPPRTEEEIDTAPTTPDAFFQGLGFYLQDEIAAGHWTLLPGVRYDRFDMETEPLVRPEGDLTAMDRSEDAVSASLGVLYRLSDRVHLTGNLGRAFRTPNIIERFFFGPGSQGGLSVPNPDLDNETSFNVEAGVKFRAPRVRGSLTLFQNEIDDFITFVPATFMGESEFGGRPVTTVDNIGEARIRGLEAEGELRAPWAGQEWGLLGAFSWTHGQNLIDDAPLFVPPMKVVTGLRWASPEAGLWARATARFVDRQDRVPEGFDETAGFAVFDLHSGFDLAPLLGRGLEVTLGIENLADRAYEEPYNAAPAPGRNFLVSVEIPFGAEVGR